jgi:hypothetical protein
MKRTLAAALAAAIGIGAWCMGAGETAPAGVSFEVQGLRIVKPAPGGNDKMRAFNWLPSTTVALLVTVPEGGLVAFDDDGSKVTSFTDDKGKDLSKPETKDSFQDKASFQTSPTISEDGKQCSTEITAPGVPTKGATALTISGKIGFQIATQKKEFTAEKVALQAGTKISAGPIALTIARAGKPEWGGSEGTFSVTLQAKQDLDSIAHIQFFDAAGKKIEASRASTGRSAVMGAVTVDWEYNLKAKVETAKIVITYWTDMKKVALPVSLTVGVGL